jgi:hypothetical protein
MGKIKNALKRLAQQWLPGNDPDFIIIGAQKAGTTSLHYYLDQHPKLAGTFPKELHFYSKYIHYPNYDQSWYRKHFTSIVKYKPLYFESSPNYIYHEEAARLIKQHHPDIKLILLLRDPVQRAYSGWNMYRDYYNKGIAQKKLADGHTPGQKNFLYEYLFEGRNGFPGFRETIDMEMKLIAAGDPGGPNIVRKGLYFDQISNYLKYFSRDQILILGFTDLIKHPAETCARVLTFLNIDNSHGWTPKVQIKNSRSYQATMDEADRKLLTDFYEEPNRKLRELLGGETFW